LDFTDSETRCLESELSIYCLDTLAVGFTGWMARPRLGLTIEFNEMKGLVTVFESTWQRLIEFNVLATTRHQLSGTEATLLTGKALVESGCFLVVHYTGLSTNWLLRLVGRDGEEGLLGCVYGHESRCLSSRLSAPRALWFVGLDV